MLCANGSVSNSSFENVLFTFLLLIVEAFSSRYQWFRDCDTKMLLRLWVIVLMDLSVFLLMSMLLTDLFMMFFMVSDDSILYGISLTGDLNILMKLWMYLFWWCRPKRRERSAARSCYDVASESQDRCWCSQRA